MSIVTPNTPATPTRQDAMRAALALLEVEPENARGSYVLSSYRPAITVHLNNGFADTAQPAFDAWLDLLGIDEWSEEDGSVGPRLTATGAFRGVAITVEVTVYERDRPAPRSVKRTRTVTR